MIGRLSDPDAFCSLSDALGEQSQLSQRRAQACTGEDERKARHAKVLSHQVTFEGGHAPPEAVHRPKVVPQIIVDNP